MSAHHQAPVDWKSSKNLSSIVPRLVRGNENGNLISQQDYISAFGTARPQKHYRRQLIGLGRAGGGASSRPHVTISQLERPGGSVTIGKYADASCVHCALDMSACIDISSTTVYSYNYEDALWETIPTAARANLPANPGSGNATFATPGAGNGLNGYQTLGAGPTSFTVIESQPHRAVIGGLRAPSYIVTNLKSFGPYVAPWSVGGGGGGEQIYGGAAIYNSITESFEPMGGGMYVVPIDPQNNPNISASDGCIAGHYPLQFVSVNTKVYAYGDFNRVYDTSLSYLDVSGVAAWDVVENKWSKLPHTTPSGKLHPCFQPTGKWWLEKTIPGVLTFGWEASRCLVLPGSGAGAYDVSWGYNCLPSCATTYNGNVIFGGQFCGIGFSAAGYDISASGIAVYNPTTEVWSSLVPSGDLWNGPDVSNAYYTSKNYAGILCLEIEGDTMYVGGSFGETISVTAAGSVTTKATSECMVTYDWLTGTWGNIGLGARPNNPSGGWGPVTGSTNNSGGYRNGMMFGKGIRAFKVFKDRLYIACPPSQIFVQPDGTIYDTTTEHPPSPPASIPNLAVSGFYGLIAWDFSAQLFTDVYDWSAPGTATDWMHITLPPTGTTGAVQASSPGIYTLTKYQENGLDATLAIGGFFAAIVTAGGNITFSYSLIVWDDNKYRALGWGTDSSGIVQRGGDGSYFSLASPYIMPSTVSSVTIFDNKLWTISSGSALGNFNFSTDVVDDDGYYTRGIAYLDPRDDGVTTETCIEYAPIAADTTTTYLSDWPDADYYSGGSYTTDSSNNIYNKCISCNPEALVIKSKTRPPRSLNTYSNNAQYLQSRCKSIEANTTTNRYPGVVYVNANTGEPMNPDDLPIGPQTYASHEAFRCPNGLPYPVTYKPNNINFGVEGAVSNGIHMKRLVQNTITVNGAAIVTSHGLHESNSGRHQSTTSSQHYFIKVDPAPSLEFLFTTSNRRYIGSRVGPSQFHTHVIHHVSDHDHEHDTDSDHHSDSNHSDHHAPTSDHTHDACGNVIPVHVIPHSHRGDSVHNTPSPPPVHDHPTGEVTAMSFHAPSEPLLNTLTFDSGSSDLASLFNYWINRGTNELYIFQGATVGMLVWGFGPMGDATAPAASAPFIMPTPTYLSTNGGWITGEPIAGMFSSGTAITATYERSDYDGLGSFGTPDDIQSGVGNAWLNDESETTPITPPSILSTTDTYASIVLPGLPADMTSAKFNVCWPTPFSITAPPMINDSGVVTGAGLVISCSINTVVIADNIYGSGKMATFDIIIDSITNGGDAYSIGQKFSASLPDPVGPDAAAVATPDVRQLIRNIINVTVTEVV